MAHSDNPSQFARHSPLATRHSPLATRHSPLATRHSPLATRHSPLAYTFAFSFNASATTCGTKLVTSPP
ncbi:hypothetical protein DA100_15600 [Vibrio sp. Hep-1b-8]|nr:hypothetical protein DA100_15600 [Vibrio sp. Hep-1b-8]